jgi:hypothetical protein
VFSRGKRRPLLPVTDLELMDWVTRSSDNVKYGTVQTWLAGVKRTMVDRRVDTSAFDTPWFKAGMKGLKKHKGESQPRRALPLTLPLLVRLNDGVLRNGGERLFRQLNLATAFALGFSCFLRCGEFTYTTFEPAFHLQRRDVTLTGKTPNNLGRGGYCPSQGSRSQFINKSVRSVSSAFCSGCSRLRRMPLYFLYPGLGRLSAPKRLYRNFAWHSTGREFATKRMVAFGPVTPFVGAPPPGLPTRVLRTMLSCS